MPNTFFRSNGESTTKCIKKHNHNFMYILNLSFASLSIKLIRTSNPKWIQHVFVDRTSCEECGVRSGWRDTRFNERNNMLQQRGCSRKDLREASTHPTFC